VAQSIIERAKVEMKERSRDEAGIRTLVDTICSRNSAYNERRDATVKLMSDYGQFAVPALVDRLGDPDDAAGQTYATHTLTQLGSSAVLPLIEALKSKNGLMRRNIATTLANIGDPRALPAMARLAEEDDRDSVRAIAHKHLADRGVSGKAIDLYLSEAQRYLTSSGANAPAGSVVWSFDGGRLVARDVPPRIYGMELARASAHDAVQVDPLSAKAREVLAQASLAQALAIEASIDDPSIKPLEAVARQLKMTAGLSGATVERAAAPVEEPPAETPVAADTLVELLGSSDKRARYEAAVRLVRLTKGENVPSLDRVVPILREAITEEGIRRIHVIDARSETIAAAKAAASQRGNAFTVDTNALDGMRNLIVDPNLHVMVIGDTLPDRRAEDVVGNMQRDSRMKLAKVIVVAKDPEAAKARFGESVGYAVAPLTGESLLQAIGTALEGAPADPRNARAEAYAKDASAALASLAAAKADVFGALGAVAGQLDRVDAVSIPAARTLGLAGNPAHLDALLGALSGKGSNDLRIASADAIGAILSRSEDCPPMVAHGLKSVLQSDADPSLRLAAALALGKAKISDQEKADLIESMRRIPVAAKE
jgi:HEAT repeat protein